MRDKHFEYEVSDLIGIPAQVDTEGKEDRPMGNISKHDTK